MPRCGADRQTDRKTGRQADKQTDRQTDRPTDRQTSLLSVFTYGFIISTLMVRKIQISQVYCSKIINVFLS